MVEYQENVRKRQKVTYLKDKEFESKISPTENAYVLLLLNFIIFSSVPSLGRRSFQVHQRLLQLSFSFLS